MFLCVDHAFSSGCISAGGDRVTGSSPPCCCCRSQWSPCALEKVCERQAWGKGRALLEALGLTGAQIARCYGMHPLNEEESVQEGLHAWIEGGRNTTWGDLLRAMETAGIAIQQRDGLKEELCCNTGEST